MDLTIEKAFEILDTNQKGIPFETIAFLQEQPTTKELLEKICYNLSNAYDEDVFYDEETDSISPAPLWYAIVAEAHTDESLIDPVIALFITEEDSWDFLNEQGMFLVGQLCEKYGDVAVDKFMEAIITYSKPKYDLPVLFMHDAIYYVDQVAYHDRMKALLNINTNYVEAIAVTASSAQYKSLLPALQSLYDFCKFKELRGELEPHQEQIQYEVAEALQELKTGVSLYPEQAMPYAQKREPWQEHYKGAVKQFK